MSISNSDYFCTVKFKKYELFFILLKPTTECLTVLNPTLHKKNNLETFFHIYEDKKSE